MYKAPLQMMFLGVAKDAKDVSQETVLSGIRLTTHRENALDSRRWLGARLLSLETRKVGTIYASDKRHRRIVSHPRMLSKVAPWSWLFVLVCGIPNMILASPSALAP